MNHLGLLEISLFEFRKFVIKLRKFELELQNFKSFNFRKFPNTSCLYTLNSLHLLFECISIFRIVMDLTLFTTFVNTFNARSTLAPSIFQL